MKAFSILIFSLFFFYFRGQIFQCNFEDWTDNHHPVGFWGAKTNIEVDSINKYSTSVHSGFYAVQLINTESTHKRLTTQQIQVDSGITYTITFWVRGKGNIRTGIYDGRTSGSGYFYNTYINVNTTEWQFVTQTVTAEVTTNLAEFIFSVQYTNSSSDHIQIDDVVIYSGTQATPTITITSPYNNSTLYTTNVTIEFNVTNFTIGHPSQSGVDGHIKYVVDNGVAQMHYTTNPINLTLNNGSHSVLLELVDNNDSSLNPPVTANVTFNINTSIQFITIYDIQYTTDPSGISPYVDDTISTGGIVTGVGSQGFFMQSGYGQWTGIYVYAPTYSSQVNIGDSVTVIGKVKEYYGLTEITNLSNLTIHSSNNILPQPYVVTAATVKTEPFEGVLVQILNAKCINPNAGYGMWTVQDQTDTCKIHNLLYSYSPELNKVYNITGPVYYAYQEYRIEPRSENDIEVVGSVQLNNYVDIIVYPVKFENMLNILSPESISDILIFNENGKLITNFSNINVTNKTLDLHYLQKGNYLLQINTKKNKVIKKIIKI